jgi:two-component system OmpR family sensor kinase
MRGPAMPTLSLRARLIAGVLLLVALAIGAVATSTYVALQSFLVSRVDRQLAGAPSELVGDLCGGASGADVPGGSPPGAGVPGGGLSPGTGGSGDGLSPGTTDGSGGGLSPGTTDGSGGAFHAGPHRGPHGRGRADGPRGPVPLLVGRIGPDGHPDRTCPPAGYSYPLHLSDSDADHLAGDVMRPVELHQPGGPVLAMARPAGAGGGLDVVAVSMDDVQATLDRLLMLELLIGALALVFAGSAGAFGVGRGLRPLTEVTDTALAVAGEVAGSDGGGLGRRVPAGSPGTEVGRLAEAFNTMLTAVQTEVAGRQESEQRMRQFLADASHELRTPLTSLRGYAELITMRERRDGVRREPESADALRRITEEGARMSRLVNDLLVLARSDEERHATGVDVALDELAVDAVADVRAAHPDRAVTLRAQPASVVLGDPDQLRQVLANLVTNAAVHTGGDIHVEVERADGQVLAVVADDGPGLTAPQAAHAFDRFWRADRARTRVKGGSGLGLSIVDTLVSAHGGTIDFDTSPSAGTTVTVRIPAAP